MIASCPDDHEWQLEEAGEQVDMRLLVFCVMPNHWHLMHGTVGTGPLYQGPFKSFPIQEDEHFCTVCRYVERNALRAILVTWAEQWRWSSLWHRVNRSAQVGTPFGETVWQQATAKRQIDTNETRPRSPALNDSDSDGDRLTVELDTGPANGTLTYLRRNGSFKYVPNARYVGSDSFTYKVFDGAAYATAEVSISVGNVAPIANADTINLTAADLVLVNLENPIRINVIANDTDADGD